ncbi:hypothetical protein [Viridibacillus arvi]|uniref:hypothetical protein n=1 Tax=Viridibacillus arvi TaxID=263475 RepID=UPI0034CFC010
MRTQVSWRLEKLKENEQKTIDAWLDHQGNIQTTLTNIAMHMINRFGNTDIMSYENQRELFNLFNKSVDEFDVKSLANETKKIDDKVSEVSADKVIEEEKEAKNTYENLTADDF